MSAWRAKAETVDQMLRAGLTDVRARCAACHAEFQIDLGKVRRERGPKTSLWNRQQARPKESCPGQVRFTLRVPGLYAYQLMVAPDSATAPKRLTLGERAKRDREGGA